MALNRLIQQFFIKLKNSWSRFKFFIISISKKIKFIHLFWILFYSLLLITLIYHGQAYLDPDFGWHLKVGQEISLTHQVPHANLYNYTYTGNWVDHEWLSNFLIYQTYSTLGYNALVIAFALLIVLTLIILNKFIRATTKAPFWLIAALQALGTIASLPHLGVRLQELAWPFILLVLIIINYYRRTKKLAALISLPILFFMWANLHASFLIGLFVLFAWLAIKLIERLKIVKKIAWLDLSESIDLKALSLYGVAALASLLATCLTPYGLNLYEFLIGYKNKAYLSLIDEWLPQYALPLSFYQLLYLAIGVIAISFYIYYRLQEKKKLDIWRLFLPLVFLVLSFESKRHFPLFFIVSFPLLSEVYANFFGQIKLAYTKYLKVVLIISLGLVLILQGLKLKTIDNPFTNFCADFPCGASNFLKNNPKYNQNNIFNDYSWGGFLIWALPERKLFIDGRLPQIAFSHWTFVEEYHDFITNQADVANKIKKYNIELVLVRANYKPYVPKFWEKLFFPINAQKLKNSNALIDYLDGAPNWQIVYQDPVSKIYYHHQ